MFTSVPGHPVCNGMQRFNRQKSLKPLSPATHAVQLATRGDGVTGQDVTRHAKNIQGLPLQMQPPLGSSGQAAPGIDQGSGLPTPDADPRRRGESRQLAQQQQQQQQQGQDERPHIKLPEVPPVLEVRISTDSARQPRRHPPQGVLITRVNVGARYCAPSQQAKLLHLCCKQPFLPHTS